MLGSTVRRTSTSSERSLDPAYVADDAHGQYPSDCPASRSISPSKTSLDRLLTTPLATLATSETATLEAAAAPDGEKGGGADEEGEKLDKLEKLGETVKKEGGSNQLKQDAYHKILATAKTPHHSAEVSLTRRIKALKLSFELYYLFSRDVDLALLLRFLDEKEEKILTQAYSSLPHLLHFCLLSPAPLSKIKSRLLPLLPLTLPPHPPTPLTSSLQTFTFHLLKKSPQNLIPDLFLPYNIQNHSSLLWLAAKYGKVMGVLGSRGVGRVRREVEGAVRGVFEGEEWAERVVGFWKGWAVRGGVSAGRLEAVNAWLGGPELVAGIPPSPRTQIPQTTATLKRSPPPLTHPPSEPKRPRLNLPPSPSYPPGVPPPTQPRRSYLGRNYDPSYIANPPSPPPSSPSPYPSRSAHIRDEGNNNVSNGNTWPPSPPQQSRRGGYQGRNYDPDYKAKLAARRSQNPGAGGRYSPRNGRGY